MHVACFNLSSYFIKEESRTSLCRLVGCAQEDDASELNDGDKDIRKRLCQVCANLIDTSWHLVAQYTTSVSASLIKIKVNRLHPCFGSRGSEVQILSPRPFKTMGYGLGRSPFFVWASTGASI